MDYSRAALDPLNENAGLNEDDGIEGPAGRRAVFGVGGKLTTAPADGNINWNGVKGDTETGVSADVNFITDLCGAKADQTLPGFDDWQNLDYNFRDSADFADGVHGQVPVELTGPQVLLMLNPPPDLQLAKSVDKPAAIGGDTLNYTVTTTNLGPGVAVNVTVTDTLPDNSTQTRSLSNLNETASNEQKFTYLVPCTTTDGTVLTNRASVSGVSTFGFSDPALGNNTAQATTTIRAPRLTLAKIATAAVNAGEAITYTITYQNTGGAGATNVVITDTVPANVYYSQALDTGTGPKPTTVALNNDGTRTLTWQVGAVGATSGPQTIRYTARPTLLFVGGETLTNSARLEFKNANGCTYTPLTASASTTITVVPPTRNPQGHGFWGEHPELRTSEILARIQATDQRYDTNKDGALSSDEVTATLTPGGNQTKILAQHLLGTYFNLATRRINAGTKLDSKLTQGLGLADVEDAAKFAIQTLPLPVSAATRGRYTDATAVLDALNANRIEVY
jgi:uncharacterized repeat protein (TIGR01451 family)